MTAVCGYQRPATLDEALAILSRPRTVVLGGGTRVTCDPAPGPVEVVDLQALPLRGIEPLADGRVRAGAMVRLQDIADSPVLPAVIREAARRERPATLRAQATLGGCVAAREADSELLAALLAHDAVVCIAGRNGRSWTALADFFAREPLAGAAIITGVAVDTSGVAAAARTARTRADRPIVAAVARITPAWERRLALAGVAATPVLAPGGPQQAGWLRGLDPPGDFRGSGEYRRALAAVLAGRVLAAVSR